MKDVHKLILGVCFVVSFLWVEIYSEKIADFHITFGQRLGWMAFLFLVLLLVVYAIRERYTTRKPIPANQAEPRPRKRTVTHDDLFGSWTCHVCGDNRPDAVIGVVSHDTSAEHKLPAGTMEQNIRYCKDRPSCVEGAQTTRHFKKTE